MFETVDTLIVLVAKLALLIGFIYSLKYWYNKKKSIIPVIVYWLLGLVFVLLISFTLFDWIITITLQGDNLGSLAAIFAILFYVFVGIKNFKINNI
ncbi:hypothetical protein [Mariniflexile sp. AS56]|uniref:hypothetical protein n=1 Tax=Mariniflexile sp. AS56 TaxID=3063957 RepID=UPI0026EBD2A1|nr:hypothetical protein [Mariniflexile sp. AS56]MDO7174255.1 hypothetical protein [Mariniflexile sp. AS56]